MLYKLIMTSSNAYQILLSGHKHGQVHNSITLHRFEVEVIQNYILTLNFVKENTLVYKPSNLCWQVFFQEKSTYFRRCYKYIYIKQAIIYILFTT